MVKIFGEIFLGYSAWCTFKYSHPNKLAAVRYTKDKRWQVITTDDQVLYYQCLKLLARNPLFSLIQARNASKKTLLIIFKDQLTFKDHWQLHLILQLTKHQKESRFLL